MTLDEARKVAKIAATADGGCRYCVADLLLQLQRAFPEFVWEDIANNRLADGDVIGAGGDRGRS